MACSLRGYSPSRQGMHGSWGVRLMVLNKRAEGSLSYQTSTLASSDSLPPARLHLLKVPQPSKTVPPAGDQVFRHRGLPGTLHIQITTTSKLLIQIVVILLKEPPKVQVEEAQGTNGNSKKDCAFALQPQRPWLFFQSFLSMA